MQKAEQKQQKAQQVAARSLASFSAMLPTAPTPPGFTLLS